MEDQDILVVDGQVVDNKLRQECEVYSRVVGYLRPVSQWNKGKQQEFEDREMFDKSMQNM